MFIRAEKYIWTLYADNIQNLNLYIYKKKKLSDIDNITLTIHLLESY